MNKLLILILILFSINVNAQFQEKLYEDEGIIGGGFGLSFIDGQRYYTFRLFPEIAFANIGLGLDIRIDLDQDGNIRKENFNETSDYLSLIRYVRYGHKNDPVYVRVGALDYSTIGHGTIMYLYNNSPSFDARKVGLEFDIDFTMFGFESVYGNFGDRSVWGLRGYVRPLQFTSLADVPIIGKVELGVSTVNDFNENAGVLNGTYDTQADKFNTTKDAGNFNVIGFDIEFPILRTSVVDIDLYTDFNKILDFGSGLAFGFTTDFNLMSLVDVRTKFERRINGDQYIASYFNSFYELERFSYDKEDNTFNSKVKSLAQVEANKGWYGELLVNVLGTVKILGSYQKLDKVSNSGILHLYSNLSPDGMPYVVRAGYDKVHIIDAKDLFTLDDRSYLYFEFGYKPVPYIIVSMIYHWTFSPERDSNDNIISYSPQKRVEPRISFVIPFSFNN